MSQQRFDNAVEQLKTTVRELAECRQALRHCMRSNRPLPNPPHSTRRSPTPAARGIRGVSAPLSEVEYEVPHTDQAAAAAPVQFSTYGATPGRRTAATIRRRRNTPSVSAQAQTYGPTPRNRTRRGIRQMMI